MFKVITNTQNVMIVNSKGEIIKSIRIYNEKERESKTEWMQKKCNELNKG